MKNKYTILNSIMIMAIVSLLAGCYKDKGNYDYSAVNKISISDPASAARIFVFQGDTLKLAPAITQTQPSDSLEYLWFVYNNSSNSSYNLPRDTIARTRNLNYVISSLVFVLGEDYRLTYKVTDKKTGISSFQLYDLTVSNKFGQGWMLFEDKPTGGDLSMILGNGSVERNVYSSRNPLSPLGKPVSLYSSSFSITDDMSAPGKRIYLLTENDGQELNGLTMIKKFDYGYLFFAKPATVKPTYQGWTGYISGTSLFQRMGVAINNGKVYTNLVGGFPGIKKWGEALINPAGTYNYDIAPFIAGAALFAATYPIVVYDNTNKKFYSVGTTRLTAFPAAASTVFDMNDVGLDLLNLDSSNVSGVYNAIMKNAANVPYLLQFKTTSTAADPVITVSKTAINAPAIASTKFIAGSTLTPHIYYGAGNKIYKYETTSNSNSEVYSFGANENIVKIIYQRSAPGTGLPRIVAATWNGTESKVYYFNVSTVGDLGATYSNVFTGFARIVDMAYKYP